MREDQLPRLARLVSDIVKPCRRSVEFSQMDRISHWSRFSLTFPGIPCLLPAIGGEFCQSDAADASGNGEIVSSCWQDSQKSG